ncbi:MAG: hypothetical protein H6731_07210 [Myxococcales bacterium]|nr:MAG: hypothetical protein H6731_07210 [Myxococcales bacterium]
MFGKNETLMLDWLNEPREMLGMIDNLKDLSDKIKQLNFESIVLMGMGGSSLAVKVFQDVLAPNTNEKFFVLDTIHPDMLERLERTIDISKTLFVVSSKSGTTLEPNLLYQHFLSKLKEAGIENHFEHFIAITDTGTSLAEEANKNQFITSVKGNPLIGGRYSALSPFGIFPALLMGIDVQNLLEKSLQMTQECGPAILPERNPGVLLGLFLGVNTLCAHDQLVVYISPSLKSFGSWLEQLIAESLGKNHGGIVPLVEGDLEHVALPHSMHCVLELEGEPIDPSIKQELRKNHSNCIYLKIPDRSAIGSEMFRWEIAISTAAIILKLNPFDQPDVEKSKQQALLIIDQIKNKKFVGPKNACYSSDAVEIFSPGSDKETINVMASFFTAIKDGDYCAILSYLDETPENNSHVDSLAAKIRQHLVPAIVQHGPRYLHSIGQLFKGGKNNGHFILITGPYKKDFSSSMGINFKDIHLSQALGDFQTMIDDNRHILHVHLKDVAVGFRELLALSKHM